MGSPATAIRTPPAGDIDSLSLAPTDQAVDGSALLLSTPLLPQKESSKGSEQRRLDLEERDHRMDLALQEQRAALERERAAYEKKRQEWDEARLVRDAQIAEVMKQALTSLTGVMELLNK